MRVRRIAMTRTFLENLFMGEEQHYKINNPLPEDIEIIHFDYVLPFDRLEIIVKSKKFDEVKENEEIPWYWLIITDLKAKSWLEREK